MSFNPESSRTGLWVFGGPYSGKTTLAKGVINALEFDTLFDHIVRGKPTPVDKRAWRADHPQHAAWTEVFDLVRRRLERHALNGGVAIAHDPPSREWLDRHREQIQVVWLHPGDDVIAKRLAADGNPSRAEASRVWQAKAAARGYANMFPVITEWPAEE